MGKDSLGKTAFARITLRPEIAFGGDRHPTASELAALHHSAHEHCYIANSLKAEVVVETV